MKYLITLSDKLVTSAFEEENAVRAFKIKHGLPLKCSLVNARIDEGNLLLEFEDGREGNPTEVVIEVSTQ